MKRVSNLQQMIRGALLIALGLILPVLFHGVRDAGSIFLPMHIPILIGAFVLEPYYALCVGVLTPLLSHVFTGVPPFPFVYIMIFELASYGLFISIFYNKFKMSVYSSLISGMILGRLVNIIGTFVLLHIIMSKPFKLSVVASGLFIKGLPGIVIQIILIPIIVYALQKSLKRSTSSY
ncbi:ECF transporter S component [Clostridium drakei]|uniref:ECF transporter S component n=1 Tax=Clostridium drakei TaxID=332101 RepID=A0A2U8DT09_9CLOT|nr:ECF transporter S component [Clostridium drakei]AWI05913.1 ECF transporter S component [Clostridium drakei]